MCAQKGNKSSSLSPNNKFLITFSLATVQHENTTYVDGKKSDVTTISSIMYSFFFVIVAVLVLSLIKFVPVLFFFFFEVLPMDFGRRLGLFCVNHVEICINLALKYFVNQGLFSYKTWLCCQRELIVKQKHPPIPCNTSSRNPLSVTLHTHTVCL